MEIRVLGPLEVVIDGRPVELPSAKARLVLAALVVRANEVVSTDRLFEVLWGAQPPESAANTLQTYVAHLRGAVEPDRARRKVGQVLITRPPGYLLAIEPDGIDAVRFERLAERAGTSWPPRRPTLPARCGQRCGFGGVRRSRTSRSNRSRKPTSPGCPSGGSRRWRIASVPIWHSANTAASRVSSLSS